MLDWKYTTQVLQQFGQRLVETYRENIKEHRASGLLQDTCRWIINTGNESIELSLSLQDYWTYIETGTKPHWPPVDAIKKWVEIKPVLPYPGQDGKLPTPAQLAFLIARKISIEGTKPDNALERSVDEVLNEFSEALDEAITRDLDEELSAILSILR